jgi:hypothetical protein
MGAALEAVRADTAEAAGCAAAADPAARLAARTATSTIDHLRPRVTPASSLLAMLVLRSS